MRSLVVRAVALVLGLGLGGCISPRMVADNMEGTMAHMKASFFAEESPNQGFYGGPALLKQLEGFVHASPHNEVLLKEAAELNCGYALTFLDRSDPVWAAHLYRKGREFALRGVAEVNEDIRAAIAAGDVAVLEKELADMDPEEDLPLVFWSAVCWGGLMNATQDVTIAADLPLVETMIAGCLDKRPDYYFGAGHAFFGMLYAGRSEMLGGDLERGREHFEKAIAITDGKFLLTRVMYARAYAVNKQDPALYVELLTKVRNSPPDDPDDMRLPNQVARREAVTLLEQIGKFFPGYTGPTGLEPDVKPLEEEDIDLDIDLDMDSDMETDEEVAP